MLQTRCKSVVFPRISPTEYKDTKASIFCSEVIGITSLAHGRSVVGDGDSVGTLHRFRRHINISTLGSHFKLSIAYKFKVLDPYRFEPFLSNLYFF